METINISDVRCAYVYANVNEWLDEKELLMKQYISIM